MNLLQAAFMISKRAANFNHATARCCRLEMGRSAIPEDRQDGGRNPRRRMFAWWYFCIAAGFVLLAINRVLIGDRAELIALRLVIAGGFVLLGLRELKQRKRGN